MSIEIKTYTSKEVLDYKESKYHQFLQYYHTTDMRIEDIFRAIGLTNNKNSNNIFNK